MGAAGHFPPRFTIVLGVQQPQHHSLKDQRALQVPFHVTACSHTCHHSGTNLWLFNPAGYWIPDLAGLKLFPLQLQPSQASSVPCQLMSAV